MAQPIDIIKDILDFGPIVALLIVKIDLTNAFKIIPVRASAWSKQAVDICGCIFIE